MRGETVEVAYPVYSSSKPGSRTTQLSDEGWRSFNQGFVAFVGVLLVIFSLRRYLRRRARWKTREHAKSYDLPDDPPPSTDLAPIPVRIDGPSNAMVVIGDDDAQFRLRARAGITMRLGDGRRCTFLEGTPLKCTFPGFTLLTKDNRGSVGVEGGTEFFVVAELPEGAPHASTTGEGPFRSGATGPVVELVPVQDRYECRLDPAPVRRKRLGRLVPRITPRDPATKPRWRPHLHPGILLAILATFATWGRPRELVTGLLFLAMLFAMGSEDAGWALDEKDL